MCKKETFLMHLFENCTRNELHLSQFYHTFLFSWKSKLRLKSFIWLIWYLSNPKEPDIDGVHAQLILAKNATYWTYSTQGVEISTEKVSMTLIQSWFRFQCWLFSTRLICVTRLCMTEGVDFCQVLEVQYCTRVCENNI